MQEIKLIKSKRKSISLEIRPNLDIVVRAPLHMGQKEIDAFIASRKNWLETHLEKAKQKKQESKEEKLTQEEIKELVALAKNKIPERVNEYAKIVGVSYGRVTIRKQVSRFGSCSSKGNLNFNCLLLLAPEEVLDYVVVHELCHRKHMNHSKLFWTEVENTLPDYKQHKKWLKDNGVSLIGKLP